MHSMQHVRHNARLIRRCSSRMRHNDVLLCTSVAPDCSLTFPTCSSSHVPHSKLLCNWHLLQT